MGSVYLSHYLNFSTCRDVRIPLRPSSAIRSDEKRKGGCMQYTGNIEPASGRIQFNKLLRIFTDEIGLRFMAEPINSSIRI